MSGAILRRRDRTTRSLRVVHYSSAVNTLSRNGITHDIRNARTSPGGSAVRPSRHSARAPSAGLPPRSSGFLPRTACPSFRTARPRSPLRSASRGARRLPRSRVPSRLPRAGRAGGAGPVPCHFAIVRSAQRSSPAFPRSHRAANSAPLEPERQIYSLSPCVSVCLDCWSARRFNAGQHVNVLMPLGYEGLNTRRRKPLDMASARSIGSGASSSTTVPDGAQ